MSQFRTVSESGTERVNTWQLSTKGHKHSSSRARVTKDRQGSGTLIVKVPWEVVGNQAVTNSMMDLGRDSLSLSLLCCVFTATDLSAQDPLAPLRRLDAAESFLLSRLSYSHHGIGRFQWSERLSRRVPYLKVSCLLNRTSFLKTPQTVNNVPPPSRIADIFGQEIEQVLVIHNSAPLSFIGWHSSSDHPLAQNLLACIFPGPEPFHMHRLQFSSNSPDPLTHTNTPCSDRARRPSGANQISFDPLPSGPTSAL